jgi:hypothetical protein
MTEIKQVQLFLQLFDVLTAMWRCVAAVLTKFNTKQIG